VSEGSVTSEVSESKCSWVSETNGESEKRKSPRIRADEESRDSETNGMSEKRKGPHKRADGESRDGE
jgi:hypothetical protein